MLFAINFSFFNPSPGVSCIPFKTRYCPHYSKLNSIREHTYIGNQSPFNPDGPNLWYMYILLYIVCMQLNFIFETAHYKHAEKAKPALLFINIILFLNRNLTSKLLHISTYLCIFCTYPLGRNI